MPLLSTNTAGRHCTPEGAQHVEIGCRDEKTIPALNLKQKSGLNRAILDQAWGEWRRPAGVQAGMAGRPVLAVPPHGSRQQCPLCGHASP